MRGSRNEAPSGPSSRRFLRLGGVAATGAPTDIGSVMFAVIRTGGKQYKVAPDDVLVVEKLAGEPGATIELGEVLIVGDGAEVSTGTPLIAGASVSAELVEHRRADKIIVFKKKRRQNYRRKNGHRQHQTVLRITEIRTAAAAPARGRTRTRRAAEPAAEAQEAQDGA